MASVSKEGPPESAKTLGGKLFKWFAWRQKRQLQYLDDCGPDIHVVCRQPPQQNGGFRKEMGRPNRIGTGENF